MTIYRTFPIFTFANLYQPPLLLVSLLFLSICAQSQAQECVKYEAESCLFGKPVPIVNTPCKPTKCAFNKEVRILFQVPAGNLSPSYLELKLVPNHISGVTSISRSVSFMIHSSFSFFLPLGILLWVS